jgi:uncharacterized oligopeptide transporter (OPT) family protein
LLVPLFTVRTGILFVSAVPAMYTLSLLSPSPSQDLPTLLTLSGCAAFFGVFFAVPLRVHFVRGRALPFPSATASAYTIRALHAGAAGAAAARAKASALTKAFAGAFALRVLGTFAPGVLFDWHVGWWLYSAGWKSAIALENCGFWIECE